MRWNTSFAVVITLVVLVLVPLPALADVTVELRPAAQFVVAGQQTGVEIYAVADPAEAVGMVKVVLSWDASSLTLIGSDSTGAHPWGSASFPGGGLNTDFSDGNAQFFAQVNASCTPATASPTGLLITTLLFDATGSPGTSTVDILPSFGAFETMVWDNLAAFCGGVVIPSLIGQSANVTIISCSADGECDDTNACTDDSCIVGVCQHPINFDDTQDCCAPSTGNLTPLDDGNDCTGGICDSDTGAVTHPPVQAGTACGDLTNTTCSAPDTCDLAGNCVPNHATDGNFCEADGDVCTRDRCANGDCVFVQFEGNGAPCDDGQDNCSPGQDICLAGACLGGGTDPCAAPGGFCLEAEQWGPSCPEGDIDCSGFTDSTCEIDPANPEDPPRCRRPYTCGQCRPGMDDCPDDGDCFAPTCTVDGLCMGFLENELCQDSLHCNGAEVCMPVGDPVAGGQCGPDPTPPCVGQSCREETCCDGQTCSEDLCECVECILDGDCNDSNACNGLELCDQVTFSCVPGAAIDCSHLNDQCLTGVCNAALPGPDLCEAVPDNEGYPCNDGVPCTSVDTCTEGSCGGSFDESPDGTVDVQWDSISLNQTYLSKSVGDTVLIDFWLAANDGNVCAISGEPCASDPECPGICDDGFTPCTTANDCTSPQFCSQSQVCAPSEHGLLTLQAVVEFDPSVLQLIGHVDPCVVSPNDCVDCVDDAACAPLGVSCYCPGGPPCGDQPGEALGVCQTGKYEWDASGFPDPTISGLDPDSLNLSFMDGQVFYIAIARRGGAQPEPKAPVLGDEPLWVTTFEFLAIGGAASTSVNFNLCTGEFPTRTRIIGDGAGNFLTGDLGQATIRIGECTVHGECSDGVPCTVDTCDAQGQCQHTPDDSSCDNGVFCDGVEICDPLSGCVSPGDPCVGQELLCNEPPGECVECLQDVDCEDDIVCTVDSCVDNVCLNLDDCPEDEWFCNGLEFCNLDTNACDHTGDPCPEQCDEDEDRCPSCEPPLVESVGPRYIAITPQPIVNPTPTAFKVTSTDWPCLSKYVGTFGQCDGVGGGCNVDADCNSCTTFGTACLSDADCMTCDGTTNPCQDSGDCTGVPCVSIEVCQISGQTCEQSSFFAEIDINGDEIPDGILATLVDDPADRAILTAEEWGTTTYPRCSQSQEPCQTDADCDIGACSFSGRGCSVSADDCLGLCEIAQTECSIESECPVANDTCSGSQTCLPFETCQAGKIYVMSPDIVPTDIDKSTGTLFPISYTVQADCGSLPDTVSVVMRLWADADDNGLINIDDAVFTIKGFQGEYPPAVPAKTVVAFDIDGANCTPNLTVNIADVLLVILAFEGGRFNPDVVGGAPGCTLPSCPP